MEQGSSSGYNFLSPGIPGDPGVKLLPLPCFPPAAELNFHISVTSPQKQYSLGSEVLLTFIVLKPTPEIKFHGVNGQRLEKGSLPLMSI